MSGRLVEARLAGIRLVGSRRSSNPSHLLLHRFHLLLIRAAAIAAAADGNIHLVRGLAKRCVIDDGFFGLAVLMGRGNEEGDHHMVSPLHALGDEGEHALLVGRLACLRLLVQVPDQLVHRAGLREPRGHRAEVEVEDVCRRTDGVCFGGRDAQVSRLDELARENGCVPLLHLLIDLEDLEARGPQGSD